MPPASRTPISRPSAPGGLLLAALTATLSAMCWMSLPAAPGAAACDHAEPPSRLTGARLPGTAGTAAVPALRKDHQDGAATGAAAVPAALGRAPVPVPGVTPRPAPPRAGDRSGVGSDVNLLVPVAVLALTALAALYASTSRRRRTTTRTTPAAAGWGGTGAAGPSAPLPELDARAGADLVDTDDAVRTSEEELGFAAARGGEEAVAPFAEALGRAGDELAAAFRLRQRLDEGAPEDEAARRRVLDEIVRRCADANGRLDAVTEDFDRLRALEHNAPQAVATAEDAVRELTGRVSAAEATLGGMRERYADSATAPVAGDLARARDRMTFATAALRRARTAVDGGAGSEAAVYVRAAEGAIGQISTLVDAVGRRAAELAEAAEKLPGALTGAETGLAEAARLLGGTHERVPTAGPPARTARAEALLADVDRDLRAGRYDPVDALRRVGEADAALDEALAGAHGREHGSLRARTLLDGSMLTARSAIGAAADYVTTNRGAVGSRARTRLAEARRRWQRAAGLAEADDPRGALAEARQADALAVRARSLAEQDVREHLGPEGPGRSYGGGGGTGGAVLGGILLGGLFGGADVRGAPGGGSGGGPGAFGGRGTRGRWGGGGRF